ncbi:phosphoribosylglycinamide synthetase [Streptomyces sp. Da 82-17]|uniref:phosphoribosylglycinamide synthetase n=1 Tax=Streptomyces sp. Da 82-17 TaxID=3377116 RepID=UPI0038D383D8
MLRIPGSTPRTAELAARLASRNPLCVLAGEESCGPLADALAERLGLPGNAAELSGARRDKEAMGRALQRVGVRRAEQWYGGNAEALADRAEEHGLYPVVVSPLSRAAGAASVLCRDRREVRRAAEAVVGARSHGGAVNSQALLREFLPGPAYTVDSVSRDGQSCIVAIHRRHTRRYGAYLLPDRAELAAPDSAVAAELVAYNRQVLDALGIRNGPSHTDLVLTPAGPVLVDAGVQLGPGVLPGYDDLSRGVNQADLTALAFAEPEEFRRRWAGRSYTKLCEAQVVDTTAGFAGPPRALDRHVVDAVEALSSVYFFDAGHRARGRGPVTPSPRPASGVAYTLHSSPRLLEEDRLRIRRLTDGQPRPQEPACAG